MRYLFSIQPALAHFHLVAPIAQALLHAGEEVAFATSRSFYPKIDRTGMRFFSAGLDWLAENTDQGFPERKKIPLAEQGRFDLGVIFAEKCPPPMIGDLLKICDDWKPDVIVRDIWEFGGYITAELLEIPHAVIGFSGGLIVPPDVIKGVVQVPLNHLRQEYKLPSDPDLNMLYRYLRLDMVPPSYRPPGFPHPPTAHTIRPAVFDQTSGEKIPDWIDHMPYERTALVTLGTVNNRNLEVFQTILSGLENEPVNVMVTIGGNLDASAFGLQPDHIRITPYLPYSLVLDRFDAVVMHGGFATLMTVLNEGLPIVFVPLAGDHEYNAQRFTELGAGITILWDQLNPGTVQAAIRDVLYEPRYLNAARGIAKEMRTQPGPEHGAKLLNRLAQEKKPIFSDSSGT